MFAHIHNSSDPAKGLYLQALVLTCFGSLQVGGWGYFLILSISLYHVSPNLGHISLSGNQLLLTPHGLTQTTRSHSPLLEMTGKVSVPRNLLTYKFDIYNHVSLMRQTWTLERAMDKFQNIL